MSWQIRANYSQGGMARGGHLSADPGGLYFSPHAVDRGLKTPTIELAADSISTITTQPRSLNLFSGGLRRRLKIVDTGGAEHLFVVNRLNTVVEELRGILRVSD